MNFLGKCDFWVFKSDFWVFKSEELIWLRYKGFRDKDVNSQGVLEKNILSFEDQLKSLL